VDINSESTAFSQNLGAMLLGIADKGSRLCGNKKGKGPSTDKSIQTVAIYQFDMAEVGGL
jgi:hypothetical protein